MTITGIQNIILEILSGHDIVTLGELKVILSQRQSIKDGEFLEKLIQSASADLEKADLLRRIDDKYFVLYKTLQSFNQKLEISADLAVEIAKVLNSAAVKFTGKEDQELCNALSISDKDIETLMYIAKEMINNSNIESQTDEFQLPPNQ